MEPSYNYLWIVSFFGVEYQSLYSFMGRGEGEMGGTFFESIMERIFWYV